MTTNFMETDWKLFRSRIDMITLDTADDAINIADTLYNTMVHTDSDIIPQGCGQTLGNADFPWESLFTSTINTGTNPLTIENDLDVVNNINGGGFLNIVGDSVFLSNMVVDHNFTVNNGNFIILNGNGTINGNIYMPNGSLNMHSGNIQVNNGIVVNNGGINIIHGGMDIVDSVNMHNTLTVNNGISLTNGTFTTTSCPINAHAGLNVQNGTTTDTLNITGQTTGGLYPIHILNSTTTDPYIISTTITSFSDNLFLINNNTARTTYNIVLPSLDPTNSSQWGAHLTIGTIVQLGSDSHYYNINTPSTSAPIFGTIAGVTGGGVNVYSTNGFQVINANRGETHELIFTPSGWLLKGLVANGGKVSML